MAITVETHTTESITLEEYVDYVSKNVDARDQDSILASSEKLKALTNNRGFLTERLNQEIREWKDFQSNNTYTAQCLLLGDGRDWFIRANIWTPLSEVPAVRDWQQRSFQHLRAHDHNFSFLTAGYLGSGYKTTIYEYEPEGLVGYRGEHVDMRFLEHTSLPQGKVMLYRASRDIHCQDHPEELSISLNLMLHDPRKLQREQYYFDVEGSRVESIVDNESMGRIMLCHLARYLNDGTTVALLEELAKHHPSVHVRTSSNESLAALEPSRACDIWEQAMQDRHEFVRRHAEAAIEALGT